MKIIKRLWPKKQTDKFRKHDIIQNFAGTFRIIYGIVTDIDFERYENDEEVEFIAWFFKEQDAKNYILTQAIVDIVIEDLETHCFLCDKDTADFLIRMIRELKTIDLEENL